MTWVTGEAVGVDRRGCARLIRRIIDPHVEFAFIPRGQQPLPDHAEPIDIPGARLAHRGGHRTLHTLLREYHLLDSVLAQIARIVDAVDGAQAGALGPAAPGLDWIWPGLPLISPDDRSALERGAWVYAALYASLQEQRRTAAGGSRT